MGDRTFTIIKPNAVADGNTGKILSIIEGNGFRIIAMKLVFMDRNVAEKFYAVHKGKPFFDELVDFMTSGPSVVAMLERDNAVAELRELAGNTDPAEAAEGTIRRMFAESLTRNAIHAADSDENARIEAAWFFKEKEIITARYHKQRHRLVQNGH